MMERRNRIGWKWRFGGPRGGGCAWWDYGALFDGEELGLDLSRCAPGVDYTRVLREAKAGEVVVRRMVSGLRCGGSRVGTVALATGEGEPVTRVDLHPAGWRELAELAADGARYRRLLARGGVKPGMGDRLVRRLRRRMDEAAARCDGRSAQER